MKRSGPIPRTAMKPYRPTISAAEQKVNRSTPLKRTTCLRSGGPLPRHTKLGRVTPLKRSKPLPAVNKARQARKTEAAGMPKKKAKDIVRERSGGFCEFRFPGVCRGRGTNFAHIKPEGQGGLYVPSNLIMSCGFGNNFPGCHAHQESNRTKAYDNGQLTRRESESEGTWMWYRGVWGRWLLDDRGEAVPAPGEAS